MTFKKGWKGGPGRPKQDPSQTNVKELTRHNLRIIMNRYMYKNRAELQELYKSGKLVMIEEMVVRLMLQVSSKADNRTFEMLVDRLCGKTPVIVESHNFDETKGKAAGEAEKLLLKILMDEKTEVLSKEYVTEGLLKKS